MPTRVVLVRHGETEWSREMRHTGLTDVPLTSKGAEQALMAGRRLADMSLDTVLTSPLSRARYTCELAGLLPVAEVEDDLVEIDYGDYEGRTTADIRAERPGWELWEDGCPNGEPLDAAAARADRVVTKVCEIDGVVVLFSHGHFLRLLTARWLKLEPRWGGAFPLETGALCVLGFEREKRAILRWNATSHLDMG
jgi:probable phosphoglycerate mutase